MMHYGSASLAADILQHVLYVMHHVKYLGKTLLPLIMV